MRIVMGLYYYYPYISGLSVYAKRLAEGLVSRGHEVIIVTSRYDSGLDTEEWIDGVSIKRIPVLMRIDKGVIMPRFVFQVLKESRKADIVLLHMPIAEALLITMLASKKTVLKYHCDPRLNNQSAFGRLIEGLIYYLIESAVRSAAATVSSSFDYAANSRVLSRYLDRVWIIPPPIPYLTSASSSINHDYFYHRANVPKDAKVVGFLGRIVYEKGIDFLIHAMRDLKKRHKDIYLVIAGDYKDVAGGSVKSTLMHFLTGRDEHIRFTGRLTEEEVDAFYRFIDVLALPSIDPLEAYGMVQVEAMLRGTPVVATDMPGVRTVVQRTGMGKIVPARDPHALATAIHQVIYERSYSYCPPEEVYRALDLEDTFISYEELFGHVINESTKNRNRSIKAHDAEDA